MSQCTVTLFYRRSSADIIGRRVTAILPEKKTKLAKHQIQFSLAQIERLKNVAKRRGCTLRRVYSMAFIEFMAARASTVVACQDMHYLATPREGKALNVIVETELLRRMRVMAETDKVSVPRCLYTALVAFLQVET